MSRKIIVELLICLSLFSCSKQFKVQSKANSKLSKILEKDITYPVVHGDSVEYCGCLMEEQPFAIVNRVSCSDECNLRLELDCPFESVGYSIKDKEVSEEVNKINNYLAQSKSERTKDYLVPDDEVEFVEEIRKICFIKKSWLSRVQILLQ